MAHVSKANNGWTGETCERCKGSGEIDTAHSFGPCPDCGGTGELYVAELDLREKEKFDDNFLDVTGGS